MNSAKQFDISIIIVNYRTPLLLCDCIRSIYKFKSEITTEIIVVDNDSNDNSEELVKKEFSEVTWLNMEYNAGFGRANNAGIKISKGLYILLLNSDTLLTESCLDNTLAYYKKMEQIGPIGLLGCKMLDLEGNMLFNSNLNFRGIKNIINENPAVRRLQGQNKELLFQKRVILHSQDHESGWLGAAFVLCNSSMFFEKNLFFDESFFMYFEDVEWCYRIKKRGLRNYFTPISYIYHLNCGSSTNTEWKWKQIILSEMLYYKKTRGTAYLVLCVLAYRINHFFEKLFIFKDFILHKKRDKDAELKLKILNKFISYCFHLILIKKNKSNNTIGMYKYAI
jgi:hypothetical protein